MDPAVIDRIRGYADDGMSDARIAATLDVPLSVVRRHLVGTMAPTNGVRQSVDPAPERQPIAVDVGPLVALPVSVPDEKKKKKKTPPPPVPIRGDRKPTDKQRAIWALVVDDGLSRVEAAERLGILAPSVRNQLIAYMEHMGIEGPIPGRSERTGPGPRQAVEQAPVPSSESVPLSGAIPSTDVATVEHMEDDPSESVPPEQEPAPASDRQAGLAPDLAAVIARLDDAIRHADLAVLRAEQEADRLRDARDVLVSLA